jgi:hypothetical protein
MTEFNSGFQVERMSGMHMLFLFIHNAPKYDLVEKAFSDVDPHRKITLEQILEHRADYDILKFISLISSEEQGMLYKYIDSYYKDLTIAVV